MYAKLFGKEDLNSKYLDLYDKMNKNAILFWIALLGFFGITGLDLLNTIDKMISDIYLKLGNLIWIILIGVIYILINKDVIK